MLLLHLPLSVHCSLSALCECDVGVDRLNSAIQFDSIRTTLKCAATAMVGTRRRQSDMYTAIKIGRKCAIASTYTYDRGEHRQHEAESH